MNISNSVDTQEYSSSNVGTLSISIELELGWGSIMKAEKNRFEQFSSQERKAESRVLKQLLRLCEEIQTPITFNVVGHLFQDKCNHNDGPHNKDWFDIDPNTNLESDPLFYAPDLIDAIDGSKIDHEICSHTFSHVPVDEVKEETLRWELASSFAEHQKFGLPKPTTLVTPYNRPPPTDILKDEGITAIREPKQLEVSYPDPIKLLWYLTRKPVTKPSAIIDDITRIYTSTGTSLTSFALPSGSAAPHPAFRMIPQKVRIHSHRRYLRSVLDSVRSGEHVHLWCHTYDLTDGVQWDLVRKFLYDVHECVVSNDMVVKTIEEIDKDLRT